MIDLNMLFPAMMVILVTFLLGLGILRVTGRNAYLRAWVLTLLAFLVGSLIATSLLFH